MSDGSEQLDLLQQAPGPRSVGAEVVPFGKYKGKPVEVLLADQDYCEWLSSQPWFRERFGNVYQTIINYGGEPQDSPEHNEMQLAFLDNEWCRKLAGLLWPERNFGPSAANYPRVDAELLARFRPHLETVYDDEPKILGRSFEVAGWDVVYSVEPVGIEIVASSLPDCICECDHSECWEQPNYFAGQTPERDCLLPPCRCSCSRRHSASSCKHRSHEDRPGPDGRWNDQSRYRHCTEGCVWSETVGHYGDGGWNRAVDIGSWLTWDRYYVGDPAGPVQVECKPDLGDDFPSVLRQIKAYGSEHGSKRVLVVRRCRFEGVSWGQVVEMFAASGITALLEAEVKASCLTVS